MQGARCRVQDARCKVEGARCTVQGARCKVQGARCKVQGARCKVQSVQPRMPEPSSSCGALPSFDQARLLCPPPGVADRPSRTTSGWGQYRLMHKVPQKGSVADFFFHEYPIVAVDGIQSRDGRRCSTAVVRCVWGSSLSLEACNGCRRGSRYCSGGIRVQERERASL